MINFPNVGPPVSTPIHGDAPGPKPVNAVSPLTAPAPVSKSENNDAINRRKQEDRRKRKASVVEGYERRNNHDRRDDSLIDIEV